ncbi:MAG: class I SAM-dependent methyltransferase [Hyphomicrobiaceae bacterium]|nr:class I SAM-dependent methyltransferase [Hyphomicrobiaceae bacterium]
MELKPASSTAVSVARQRAAHQILDGDPKVHEDRLIVGLVPETTEVAIRAAATVLQQEPRRRARANFVLRSRYAEDLLEAAVRTGTRQYVILGAGLDTFGCRQPEWAKEIAIVEIDHPASQNFKRAHLHAAGIALPRNLHFAPIDFESESLSEKFASLPLSKDQTVFFSWLGVTQYLERSTLSATLKAIAAWPGGGHLVLTHIHDDWSALDEVARVAMETAESFSVESGEPWLSKLSEPSMKNLLHEVGFAQSTHLSTSEAKKRYFDARTDGLEPAGGIGIAYART